MSIGGLSKARLGRMRDVMAGHVERGDVPGIVTLVSRRGEVHVDAIGMKADGGSDPMRRDTIFRIATLTKPITAAATMALVEECKLRLDEPADRLLPELLQTQCPRLTRGTFTDKEICMETVTSTDGTAIVFERFGDGQPVIVVGGQLCDRALTRPTAEELAKHFTVINYDRRGRGDSGDTASYAVEREIEDLGALIAEAGGTASVYAHSSGAGLAIHAAAAGLPIARLVLHEPPYTPDGDEDLQREAREISERLRALLAEDRRGDAVELVMTTTGMPQEMVEGMRQTPRWAELEAMAPTIAYDSEVMGDISTGGTVPTDLLGRVTIPALVLCGGASPAWMIDVGRQVADGMPNGRLRVLEGQEHVVPPEVLVPVLAEFFAD